MMTPARPRQIPSGTGGDVPDGFRRAIKAFDRGKLDKAIGYCEQILEAHPHYFDAVHLLAVAKSKAGCFDDALRLFDDALKLRPVHPSVSNNRGTALVNLGRLDEALASYDRALTNSQDFADAHNNRGCVLMFLERYEEALTSYGKALVLVPDNAEYMNNMGRAFTRLLRYDEALACFDDAIFQRPKYIEALLNRGRVLEELLCHDEAVACFGRAMDAGADMTEVLLRRAAALHAGGRFKEALSDYTRAQRIAPERHDILLGRGGPLAKLGRIEDALEGFDRALTLGVDRVSVLHAKCLALNSVERWREALEASQEAADLAPENADVQNAHGIVLMNNERFEEAMACYEKALALRPSFPVAEWNLGYLSLLYGRFVDGFRWYEARRRQEGTRWTQLAGPEWRGQPLEGKRILLYGEQAFGDTIHFARYVGAVAARGAEVILGVYEPIAELLRRIEGAPQIVRQGEHTPPYDYHAPLMSVPFILGHDEKDTPGRPYLHAEDERIAAWAARLPDAPLKVGIAWQGSLSIPGRSIPLADFAPLGAIPGVSLISLQKSDGLDQLEALPAGMTVQTLGADFDSGPDAFLDTAAVMMSLDLIVSCDTAIAHLAGALGRPTWIVLKTVPDWRWMLHRSDSPWYPTARLFRRRKNEEWAETMNEVARALRQLACERAAPAGD